MKKIDIKLLNIFFRKYTIKELNIKIFLKLKEKVEQEVFEKIFCKKIALSNMELWFK